MANSAFSQSAISVPVTVANGGTGDTSLTAYAPLFGGTTSTGNVQSGAVGTTGQMLTSNGASAIATMQWPSAVFDQKITYAAESTTKTATLSNTSAARGWLFIVDMQNGSGGSSNFQFTINNDSGANYDRVLETNTTIGTQTTGATTSVLFASNADAQNCFGTLYIDATRSATNNYILMRGLLAISGGTGALRWGRYTAGASPITSFEFSPSTGNWTGTIDIFRIPIPS